MIRVLFVDDERRALDGLKRSLHRVRREWDMVFLQSGEEGLAALQKQPFDVVVSDIRMPGMDGIEFLSRVRKEHPDTVRVVLSGQTDLEFSLQAIPVAHQFLAKPCSGERLKDLVQRTCTLRDLFEDVRVRKVVSRMGALPSQPALYLELSRALEDPDAEIQHIASIVERDIAMCAKLLQVVNSAFIGLPRRLESILETVAYLGTNLVRSLVLSVEAFEPFKGRGEVSEKVMSDLQRHSMTCAEVARAIAPTKIVGEEAYMAAMLHDVGKLIIAAYFPDEFRTLRQEAGPYPVTDGRERQLLGASHTEIGGYLLSNWGFSPNIVEAVVFHHDRGAAATPTFDALACVHIASSLTTQHTLLARDVSGSEVYAPDAAYLKRLGLTDEIEAWGELAAKEVMRQIPCEKES